MTSSVTAVMKALARTMGLLGNGTSFRKNANMPLLLLLQMKDACGDQPSAPYRAVMNAAGADGGLVHAADHVDTVQLKAAPAARAGPPYGIPVLLLLRTLPAYGW